MLARVHRSKTLQLLATAGPTLIVGHGITDTGSAFLHKPCTPAELLRTVDLLLREPSGAGAV